VGETAPTVDTSKVTAATPPPSPTPSQRWTTALATTFDDGSRFWTSINPTTSTLGLVRCCVPKGACRRRREGLLRLWVTRFQGGVRTGLSLLHSSEDES